jgi:membrane protein
MPFVLLCATFTFLYKFIPYTKVRLSSALIGGATAGILWQLVGTAFAAFVANSARYAAESRRWDQATPLGKQAIVGAAF